MTSIKFIASQARIIFRYKSTRTKALKCCANIYFNTPYVNYVGSHIVRGLRFLF